MLVLTEPQGEASWSWASSAEWSHVTVTGAECPRGAGRRRVLCGQTSAGFQGASWESWGDGLAGSHGGGCGGQGSGPRGQPKVVLRAPESGGNERDCVDSAWVSLPRTWKSGTLEWNFLFQHTCGFCVYGLWSCIMFRMNYIGYDGYQVLPVARASNSFSVVLTFGSPAVTSKSLLGLSLPLKPYTQAPLWKGKHFCQCLEDHNSSQ